MNRLDSYSQRIFSSLLENIQFWIEANGYQVAGPSREIYFTDPSTGVPPSEYVTEVQFPVEKAK